jgi:ankyrin repeat protein
MYDLIDTTLDEYYTNNYTIEKITSSDLEEIILSLQNKDMLNKQDSIDNKVKPNEYNMATNDDKLNLMLHLITNKISENYELNENTLDDIEQLFVNYKNILNIPSKTGETILHHIVFIGNYSICRLVLKYGANTNAKDKDGQTPLHRIVFVNNDKVIGLLLNYGANIDEPDNNGNTPLHLATLIKNMPIIKILLQYGATRDYKNLLGLRPIDFALSRQNDKLIIDPEIEEIYEKN